MLSKKMLTRFSIADVLLLDILGMLRDASSRGVVLFQDSRYPVCQGKAYTRTLLERKRKLLINETSFGCV